MHVDWLNGAHMTIRLHGRVAHFLELCSAVGREYPTGLYTALCENLPAAFQSLGVEAATMEPATDFARAMLLSRGEWIELKGFYLWPLAPLKPSLLAEAEDAVRLAREERARA
jgi:hypothetical protein